MITRLVGRAGELHARPFPDPVSRAVWVLDVERPALVLGSTQPDTVVDGARARATGVDVARRRSGGGAVLLVPGEHLWIDVVLPRDDRLWHDDVGRAGWWLGDVWAGAIGGDAEVHHGPLRRDRWSDLVCFAGLGPGEVTVGGRKVVGISQRRTRAGARFQCVALAAWDPRPLLDLLAVDGDDDALVAVAAGAGPLTPLRAALLDGLREVLE